MDISKIRIDGGTQPRGEINTVVVDEYAVAIADGADFPSVVVFFDGANYWLADGFHRFHAFRKAGKADIPAKVKEGTLREAILYSVGANSEHGLRRTNEDKRKAVLTLLNDSEWVKWSNVQIAKACNVSVSFARALREEVTCYKTSDPQKTEENQQHNISEKRTYVNRQGQVREMDVVNIGRKKQEEKEEKEDFVTANEIIDDLQKQNREQSELIESLSKDDKDAEIVRLKNMCVAFERRINDLLDQNSRLKKDRDFYLNLRTRACKILRLDDPRKLIPTLESIMREGA